MRPLLALFLLAPAACTQDIRQLTILHSNDLHARLLPDSNGIGGMAHLATLVRRERAGCTHCVYVNAGDFVQGTPVSTLFRGTPLFLIANRMGIDFATLGNHEFDYGHEQIREFLRTARFPIYTANVVDETGALVTPRAYEIKEINGIRVAFLGMVMGNLVSGFLTPQTAGNWKALPVTETAKRYAAELAPKVDLIVLVGHILQSEGSEVLREVPAISVVIEGHNHGGRSELEVRDHRVVAGCRAWGTQLCRLDLEFDLTQKRLVSWNWKKITVDSKEIPAAPDVKKLIDKWEKRVSDIVDVPIGESGHAYERADLRHLMETAMREELGADFAYMNTGGVRDRLPAGKLLARNVWNIMPFDNEMMIAKVPGSRVPAAFRGNMTLDPDRLYTIALHDFSVTNEGERERLGIDGIEFQRTNRLLRDLLIDWIRKKKVLP